MSAAPIPPLPSTRFEAAQHRVHRWHGLDTGWRRLPFVLAETPRGGRWRIETDEAVLHAAEGETLFVPDGLRHRLVAECPKGMRSSWVYLRWETEGAPLRLNLRARVLPSPALARSVEAAARLFHERPPGLVSLARLHRHGLELLEAAGDALRADLVADPRIARVLAFARENISRSLTRADLARVAGLSETRFHDVFHAAIGEAPVEHLHRLRLQRAVALLADPASTVSEVGQACGFASPFHFSRFFRSRMGVSPREFRRQLSG